MALADGGEKEPVTIVPGETIIMPKAVQNDIPDGYDVYVKVVIYHAWDTKSGGLVSAGEADDIYVHNQDWIIGYEDDEQMVMYYTKPLAPEQTTTNFIDGIHFKESMGNGFADAVYTLEYEVTAVQANNAKDAIKAETRSAALTQRTLSQQRQHGTRDPGRGVCISYPISWIYFHLCKDTARYCGGVRCFDRADPLKLHPGYFRGG